MPLKRHHKWLIGSASTVIIIFMITISVFTYLNFVRQEVNYNLLDRRLGNLKTFLQNQINLISEDVGNTQILLEESQEELSLLKASAGEDFSGIYSNAVESVVIVTTDTSQGTGFIIDEEGYIATNYHILEEATAAGIYTSSGEGPYGVELIGTDPLRDVALLKIDGSFKELSLGDSNKVNVGEKVIAIGNPYGLQFSATVGSISQTGREGPNGLNIYLQIDAAINPGNSGGPVIDSNGEVMGMVNFKIGDAEGLGFALESNSIKEGVNEIAFEYLNRTLI
jgi:S1-C subfamily serine protease